jgi:predicted PurR-regulated permease PerM
MNLNWRIQGPLVAYLVVVAALALVVCRYFLLTFTVAAAVALLLAPYQDRLARRLGGRQGLAAALVVLVCAFAVVLPLLVYGALLTHQALGVIEWARPQLEPEALDRLWRETLPARYPLLMRWLARAQGAGAPELLSRALALANEFGRDLLVVAVETATDVSIFLMLLFFLLRDGSQLRDVVRGVSPLTRGQETEMVDHLTRTTKGVLLAMVLVPLVQGLVALPAFWALGLPAPLVWSMMTILAALVPFVGTPLVWVPAGLFLLLTGSTGRGFGMLLYGAIVIASVDNLLKPLILKGAAEVHTMLAFLFAFGGLLAFGAKGLVAGPVILSLVISAYRVYRYDVLRWRDRPDGGP